MTQISKHYLDIGSRENFDRMLEKATFRDFLYLYDHSVFRSIEEVDILSDIMSWINDEPMKPNFDVYDRSLYPFACEEDTLWMRKRRAQDQSPFRLLFFFSRMFRLPRLYDFIQLWLKWVSVSLSQNDSIGSTKGF